MPVLAPAGNTSVLISNLVPETVLKLENRTSEINNVARWLRDAIVEISGNPDLRDSFPELEIYGAITNLTGGSINTSIQEYPEAQFIELSSDFNIKTLDFLIWIDYPTNQQRRQLVPTQFQEADKYQSFPSLPNEWYRFGNTIGFEPTPNQNYQVQARIQRRHPILDWFNQFNQLSQTPVLLQAEWYEVLEWAAAMRGFAELLEFEKMNSIKQLLWGDPAHPNDNPGLIASVKTKRRQESWLVQQPLRPVIKSSCWGV